MVKRGKEGRYIVTVGLSIKNRFQFQIFMHPILGHLNIQLALQQHWG